MKIVVDLDLCQGHGVCQEEAPEIFRVREVAGAYDRVELIRASPDEGLRDKAEAAARYCPNRVISILDD